MLLTSEYSNVRVAECVLKDVTCKLMTVKAHNFIKKIEKNVHMEISASTIFFNFFLGLSVHFRMKNIFT